MPSFLFRSIRISFINDDEESTTPHVKAEKAKAELLGDLVIGCLLLGNVILLFASSIANVQIAYLTVNAFFFIVGCWTIGFLIFRFIIRPFMIKNGYWS